jgi:alternate signal-mediated exported protein
MNKLTKGAIATAAGIALLMGGAGTFAYWNSSVGVTGGQIVAGQLNIAAPATAPASDGWYVQTNGTGSLVAIPDITKFVASPGDKFTYQQTVNVTATGNNLVAILSYTGGAVAASSANANDVALAKLVSSTTTVTATGTGIAPVTPATTPATYTVTPGAAGITAQPVVLTATITWPKSSTASVENTAMLGKITMAPLTIALDQTH